MSTARVDAARDALIELEERLANEDVVSRAERRLVNDEYQAAEAEQAVLEKLARATAGSNQQTIEPEGVASLTELGVVG